MVLEAACAGGKLVAGASCGEHSDESLCLLLGVEGWAAGLGGAAPEAVLTLLHNWPRDVCWLKVEHHSSNLASFAFRDTSHARATTSCKSLKLVGLGSLLYSFLWTLTRWLRSCTSSL
ncbi:hypothetical protein E2C01_084158 [Portunus trituberculatus]|uniref:Uncharacterized protein n=1 Tax=Portunus trituberculatus TaxID=210409 RepID=A0A5B7IZ71_PORTR|nr:hypothetical protein [Portunus trituberculatus]